MFLVWLMLSPLVPTTISSSETKRECSKCLSTHQISALLTILPSLSLLSMILLTFIPDLRDLSSLSGKDEERKSILGFQYSKMKIRTLLSQQRKSRTLDRFIWTLCTLEWASVAFRLLTNAPRWITLDTYMISYCLLRELWRHSLHPVQFRRENYLTMIWGGQSSSRV